MRLIGLALLTFAAPVARAQCDTGAGRRIELAGQVVDARALVPLRATVWFTVGADTLLTVVADSSGSFEGTLCGHAGLTAHFRRPGYRADSLAIPLDGTRVALLDVAMTPLRDSPTTLAESRVAAPRTLSAAERRARGAGGIYIGADEIERANPAQLSDLFRNRRGVRLEDVDGALRLVSARGARPNLTDVFPRPGQLSRPPAPGQQRDTSASATSKPAGGGESCALQIGVNGHLMPEEYRLDEMPVSDVLAIEVYSSVATMPVEFSASRRGANCGLAMIWTRNGVSTP